MRNVPDIHLVFTRNGFGLGRHMATQERTKQRGLRVGTGALLLAFSGASISHAQDAGLTTPPELKDFRLDPPPEDSVPSPEVRPSLPKQNRQDAPPPAQQPTAEPQAAPVVTEQGAQARQPQPTKHSPSADRPQDGQAEKEAGTQKLSEPQRASVESRQADTPPKTDALIPAHEEGMGRTEAAALAALLLAIAATSYLLWRRKMSTPSVAAVPLHKTAKAAVPRVAGVPARPQTRPFAPDQTPLPARAMTMAFVPDNAVVSFSSLSVQGAMQIANAGEADSGDLALHAILISASSEQKSIIDSFLAYPNRYALTPLGSLKPGEKIELPLKLGATLNEMQAFSVQNKTLVAPILVAKLSRLSAESSPEEMARLVCMIGRETIPPRPKMAPLRLDQGPRRFSRLGQRALAS